MVLARANTDLVAGSWLSSLPGLNAGMVGTTVPEKAEQNAALVTSGFVTYLTVGGTPDMYVPERKPAVQIKTYGFVDITASRKPQWALANSLAEQIVNACYSTSNFNQLFSFNPANTYSRARVQQAHPLGEPRRIYGDRAYWAIYQFDLQLYWLDVLT